MDDKMHAFVKEGFSDDRFRVFINDRLGDLDIAAALPMLSGQRREFAMSYRNELGRRTSIAAYLLLREALRRVYGITEKPIFEYGEHGKPMILGHPDIHFSISHCQEAAVCAVSEMPIGIDVESVRKFNKDLARYTMNDEELHAIMQSERSEVAFTRLWTRKEAVVKRSGRGIAGDMKHILDDAPEVITVEEPSQRYIYSICPSPTDNE